MTRWTKFIARFLIGLTVLVGLNWGLQASAQFRLPRIPKIPVNIPVNIPGLEDLLSKDPALTTSIEDAQQEIPFLDSYNPSQYKAMRLLPRTKTNGFLAQAGDYLFNSQSYCLKAGTHGPGSGDGYLYAPLKGSAADIIQNVLRRSVDHPDIPQRQVQVLLWAIIAQTDLASLPGDRLRVAKTLLSDDEFSRLSRGALGEIPDKLLQRALRELPPVAQEVFKANARIRSTITRANSTFEDLERIAVLLGEPPMGENSRNVPVQRWSYNPDGYFVRYLPSGYSKTEMHVTVPEPIQLTRDTQGRITALTDPIGNRIEIGYDDTIAPLAISRDSGISGYALKSIRMIRDELLPPEEILSFDQTWSDQGWTLVGVPAGGGSPQGGTRYTSASSRYQQAVAYQQQQTKVFKQVEIASNSKALKDLADVYHLKQAIESAIAPPTNTWKSDQLALLTHAWQYQLCRHAGACSAVAHQPGKTLLASANGIYLAQDDSIMPGSSGGTPTPPDGSGGTPIDPSDGAAVPGNTGKQRLGESSRPVPEDEIPPEKDPPCQQVARELAGAKRTQAVFNDPQVRDLAHFYDLTGFEYNKVVKEVIAQQRDQGDAYEFNEANRKAAIDALTADEETGGSKIEIGASTSPYDCKITMIPENRQEFVNEGEAGAIWDAYHAHEQVHEKTCNQERDPDGDKFPENPDGYIDYMYDIDNYSQNEVDAYQVAIDYLQRWLDKNC